MTTCPKCRRTQYFVCGNKKCVCYKIIPKDKKPQKTIKNKDAVACPYCGFTEHIDYWSEREIQQFFKKNNVESFAEYKAKIQ